MMRQVAPGVWLRQERYEGEPPLTAAEIRDYEADTARDLAVPPEPDPPTVCPYCDGHGAVGDPEYGPGMPESFEVCPECHGAGQWEDT